MFFIVLTTILTYFTLSVLLRHDSPSSHRLDKIWKRFVGFISALPILNSLSSAVSSWRGNLQTQEKLDLNDCRLRFAPHTIGISLAFLQAIPLRATYVGIQRKFARFATAFPPVIENPLKELRTLRGSADSFTQLTMSPLYTCQ